MAMSYAAAVRYALTADINKPAVISEDSFWQGIRLLVKAFRRAKTPAGLLIDVTVDVEQMGRVVFDAIAARSSKPFALPLDLAVDNHAFVVTL